MTQNHKDKIRKALIGKPKTEAHKNALRIPKSEETKKKLSLINKTKETQDKRKKTMLVKYGVEFSNQDPNRCYFNKQYWINKGFSKDEAQRKITHIQTNNYLKVRNRKSFWQSSFWIENGFSEIEARKKVHDLQVLNSSKSRITVSKSCKNFLDKLENKFNVKINREIDLCNRFKVDGFIRDKNIVIEYFGSFWHMNPLFYEENDINVVTKMKAKSVWNEDNGRIKYLNKAGYETFIFWDIDSFDEFAERFKNKLYESN